MMLQRMTSLIDKKTYTGFIEKKKDGGIYFSFYDPDYDNGKHTDKGRWLCDYIQHFKPDF